MVVLFRGFGGLEFRIRAGCCENDAEEPRKG